MRTRLPAAALALVLSASFALAAGHTATGVIAEIDAKAPTITLKTGKVKMFWLDKAISFDNLKVGERVKITYDMVDNKPTASDVTIVRAPAP